MKDFVTDPTCNLKFDVFLNRSGNILQPGETISGKKSVNVSGIRSDITIDETINTENSSAIHNGVAGLMWLLSGSDEGNFDELSIKKTMTEIVEDD